MTLNTLKVENKKLIDKSVMKWMFSYWPCYRFSGSRIGLRMPVLAGGFASSQYSNPPANTTALGPVTGLIDKLPFNKIILFIYRTHTVRVQCLNIQ